VAALKEKPGSALEHRGGGNGLDRCVSFDCVNPPCRSKKAFMPPFHFKDGVFVSLAVAKLFQLFGSFGSVCGNGVCMWLRPDV
jgi:hypothetical protein